MSDIPTIEGLDPDLGIRLKSYATLGSLTGMGKATFTAREMIELGTDQANHFIDVLVEASGSYERSGTAVIPFEQIDKVISSLISLKKAATLKRRLSSYECEFAAGTGFRAIIFDSTDGKTMFSLSAEGVSCFFSDSRKIDNVVEILILGKKDLSSLRASVMD